MSLRGLLNVTVTLRRPSVTKDVSGGSARVFAAVDGAEGLPASVQPLSDQEQQKFAARQLFVTHAVYLDQDPGVLKGDVFRHDVTGKDYVILSFQDQAGRGRLWAAYAREQQD